MKTPEQMFNEKQKNIERARQEKYARMDKQQVSIMVSWAFNCAVAVLSSYALEDDILKEKLIYWRDWFIQEYQKEMLNRLEVPKTDMSDWQEDYNKLSALDDIKAEENLPIIEQ